MTPFQEEEIKHQRDQAFRELAVLYEVSCAMRTTLHLNNILYIILTGVTAQSGLGYNRAILYLKNPNTRCLECKMAIGPESGEDANTIWTSIEASRQKLDDLISSENIALTMTESKFFHRFKDLTFPLDPAAPYLLSQAFHRGTSWYLTKNDIAQFQNDPLLQAFQTQELIIMPLKAKDNVNGLIIADNIYTQKPITDDDIRIFTMLANQAGLAIENSNLYEMIVQKSQTDPITQLWNHGYFQDTLSTLFKKAEENQTPLSLALMDIDDFKKLNDTYGHQSGDQVLREIGEILKELSRTQDIICRYGGEEFAMILDATDKKQSYEIAERLRVKIEQKQWKLPNDFKMTVSIGVANFPDDAKDKEELIAKADRAMYIAKFSGKNQTCISESPF